MTTSEEIEIETDSGKARAYVATPDGSGVFPGVLFYMDAFGLRPTMEAMAQRVAAGGFTVLAPDLYHGKEYAPIDPKSVFAGPGPEMERVMKLASSVGDESAMRDTRAWLDALAARREVRPGKVGCVGYCMGGGLALLAACTYPDRVGAVASFHGGRFVTDAASPDAIVAKLRAATYLGVAEIDRRHTAEVSERLEAAFTKANVPHAIELYAGASHGFAVPDVPAYDRAASERHFDRMLDWFGEHLAAS